ncbi:MAG: BtrH N-terminal domain-containing protein [Candidatus Calescibacterium sp.]|nr:BtrH N-terminal domain-containing protein [Candidatus Calescibacterium sp.]MCX7734635.1 BtrH N-terminal domain-containing protein [bacterium]MDW8087015.1 BtrH N-terminal domain-containing protein [Candidatus Calescibacterium sp.]
MEIRREIKGFKHSSGKNCGSTSVWNVSKFYGNPHQEHNIFGLAAGMLFFYGTFGAAPKSIGGRNPTLVEDFFDDIDLEKKWESHEKFPKQKIKEFIENNIPVLARTDLYYLSYYGKGRIHFPGHEIVIFGYIEDDKNGTTKFIVSDSSFDEPQIATEEELSAAMNPAEVSIPLFPLENYIMPVEEFKVKFERENILKALNKVHTRMAQLDTPFMGLGGLRTFSEDVKNWFDLKDSWWVFRFAYQVIERRGTGGGSFRYMFSDFLKDAAQKFTGRTKKNIQKVSEMIFDSANTWRELAYIFKEISEKLKEGASIDQDQKNKISELAKNIYQKESEAFILLQKVL